MKAKMRRFKSVWDAIEVDPIKAANMKMRSSLMMVIVDHIKKKGLTQTGIAKQLHITQPRVSALMKSKINEFRLDTLVNMANRLGLHVTIKAAA